MVKIGYPGDFGLMVILHRTIETKGELLTLKLLREAIQLKSR